MDQSFKLDAVSVLTKISVTVAEPAVTPTSTSSIKPPGTPVPAMVERSMVTVVCPETAPVAPTIAPSDIGYRTVWTVVSDVSVMLRPIGSAPVIVAIATIVDTMPLVARSVVASVNKSVTPVGAVVEVIAGATDTER